MKSNRVNGILVLGLGLSVVCSFVFNNVIVGSLIFCVFLVAIFYKQKPLFIAALATNAYKKGNIEKSFVLYEKAIAHKNCPVMICIHYAYKLIVEGKTLEGMRVLKTLEVSQLDEEQQLNYNATQAMGIWKEGSIGRAIEIYQALLNERDSVLIYETLGYLLVEAQQYTRALEINLKAIELYPSQERIKSNLATNYYYLKDFKKASQLFKALIEDYVGFSEPYYYYAEILREKDKNKGALKYSKMAFEQKKSHIYELSQKQMEKQLNEIKEKIANTVVSVENHQEVV